MSTPRPSTPLVRKKARKSAACSGDNAWSYSQSLFDAFEQEGLRKGTRTELRLRWATCQLLETSSLSALKVQDICAHLDIAQGTFYQYFPDRDTLLEKLLQDFVIFLKEKMDAATLHSAHYAESVRLGNATYCRLFEQNRGLMKCLLNHYEAFPKAKGILQSFNSDWIERVVAAVKNRRRACHSASRTSDAELLRRAYALGGMVDQYLSSLYLYGDESIMAVAGDADDVVRTLSYIWTQAFEDQFEAPSPA